ncbi:MAG: ABC transporter substrate-binding protein [Candidatus Dormibacteria bacterium]
MSKRGGTWWAALIGLAVSLSACAVPTPPQDSSVHSGGNLVVSIDAFPESLNPLVAGDVSSVRAYAPLFPNLYEATADLSVRPDLAAALPSVSPDGLTWTVPLRPGARWSDGKPIDADDVVYTVRTEADPRLDTRAHFDWSILASVDAVDAVTVKFTLKKPFAPFLADDLVMPIVPRHALADADISHMSTNFFGTRPTVTGGPYRFANRDEGRFVVYTRNPRYYGARPNFDLVAMSVTRDPVQVGGLISEGVYQWAPGMTREAAARARGQAGVRFMDYPELGYYGLVLNTRQGHLFDSAGTRQGLNLGLDREAIARAAGGGDEQVMWGDINPSSWAFDASASPAFRRDVAAASARLRSTGWLATPGAPLAKAGRTLEAALYFPSEDPSRRRAAEAIAAEAAATGIRLHPTAIHGDSLRQRLEMGDFEVALVATGVGLDPDNSEAYHSPSGQTDAHQDPGAYSNLELDHLLDQERSMAAGGDTTSVPRRTIFSRVESLLASEVPIIPLWTDIHHQAFNDSVSGIGGAGNNLDQDRASSFYASWYLHA